MQVRNAEVTEVGPLARVWYDAWQDAHADLLPAQLKRIRTLQSFAERLEAALPNVRVVGPINEPLGLCIVKEDELYQLFVAAGARGSGVAAVLMADAETRLAESGVDVAWLACAIGNERAARFYEKHGWQRTGVVPHHLDTQEGPYTIEVWRYEKQMRDR